MTEHDIYAQIADYMRYQYPDVIYRFDLAADLKLSIGQARKHKRLQHYRGYPDMFIAEPRVRHTTDYTFGIKLGEGEADGTIYYAMMFAGLYLEIKKPGTRIFTKKGLLVADEHIREQYDMLESLRQRGYKAEFAIGFDEAKRIIDEYLRDGREETETNRKASRVC